MASMVYLRCRPRSILLASAPACSLSSRSHLFSSSSSPPDFNDGNPQNTENNQTDARSSFNDLKSHLRDRETSQQPPRKPFSFSQRATSTSTSLDEIRTSLDEIRNNLKGYRLGVQGPQPASQAQPVLFHQIYKQSFSDPGPANRSSSRLDSIDSIKESLRRMNVPEKRKAPIKLSNLSDSLRGRPNSEETNSPGSRVIGGTTEGLPFQVFGKELLQSKKGESAGDVNSNGLVKGYSWDELGEQSRKLWPEGVNKEENRFSISELNQRLIKLREIEKNKITTGGGLSQLKESLQKLQIIANERGRMNSARRFDIIGQLSRGTPNYMSTPPEEHLVEKYPDNMSAADKLKLELKRVRDEFKMSDTDCGSTRVQNEEKDEIEYLKADSMNVTSLMLAGMKPDPQKKFEHQDAYTIIKEQQKVQQRMNQYETHKAIIDSTLVKGKPVGPHVLDMIGLFSRMESLGAPYDPVLAADIVLSSLHDGFASFIMRFHMDGLKPSLNELHGMLVDAEKNMDIDKKKKVLNVNNGTGFKKEAKARSNISRKGKDVAKSENGSKSNVDADHDCLYCKANGHWKRDCSKYLEDMKDGALSSNT